MDVVERGKSQPCVFFSTKGLIESTRNAYTILYY